MEDGEIVEAVAMEESNSKFGRSPFTLLQETKSAMEDIVSSILSIKSNKGDCKNPLSELVTQMCLHFVSLRQANRAILVEEDKVKGETERSKAPVDFTTLQFHNLMYEKSHYLKGIKACKDFKSKYPDIDLVPESDFLNDAPQDIKSLTLSDDTHHNINLQRLNYELHQRKQLCKMKDELEKKKKSLLETIANRKKFLSSLPSHLKALKKASLPVQTYLGINHSKKKKQQSMAELLPPPLYVLFSQLVVQKEAFGESIDVEITGNVKDAMSLARDLANDDDDLSDNKEDDGCEEDDEGQRRRKRPKKAAVKSQENWQAHPLKVILQVDNAITLQFEYLFKQNVVCVCIEGSNESPQNSILCNLFPDDTGVDLPRQFSSSCCFDEARASRPYKWAQHLAGIDFLPQVPPMFHETSKQTFVSGLSLYRLQNRARTVVQRIRARKMAHVALEEQLHSLSSLKWPPCKVSDSLPWTSHKISCELRGWSRGAQTPHVAEVIDLNKMGSNEEDGEVVAANQIPLFSKTIYSPVVIKKNHDDLEIIDADSDGQEVSSEDDEPNVKRPWSTFGVKDYILVLSSSADKNRNATLEAKVSISMEYPVRPPLFSLNVFSDKSKACELWFNDLRAMEAEVNVRMVKQVPTGEYVCLLTHQIRCLAMLFDSLVEDEVAKKFRGRERRRIL